MVGNKTSRAKTKAEPEAPESQPSPKPRKRLNLDLTPEAYELLQKLAEDSGKNMAEILRTGLALYGIAQEEKSKGRSLAVVDENEQVKKQIVLP